MDKTMNELAEKIKRRGEGLKGITGPALSGDQRGSTLIIVSIGIIFMGVLGAIIIAVSTASLQMKYQDYSAKANLYDNERVLDDIYHGIGNAVTEDFNAAYYEVLSQTADPDNPGELSFETYATQDAAFYDFSKRFVLKLIDRYGAPGDYAAEDTSVPGVLNQADLAALHRMIAEDNAGFIGGDQANSSIRLDSIGGVRILSISGSEITAVANIANAAIDGFTTPDPNQNAYDEDNIPGKYIFKDVRVSYRDPDDSGVTGTGYESTITTDIEIEVPYLNFFQDSSRIFEYAMIANRGIYFDGDHDKLNSRGARTVVGNVYAGLGTESDPDSSANIKKYQGIDAVSQKVGLYGGLNMYNSDITFSSNYLIAKGDINLRSSTVNFESQSAVEGQVWTESIRTVAAADVRNETGHVGSKISSRNTSFYVANDMELNEDDSSFIMDSGAAGNYYGYNAGNMADDAADSSYKTWERKKQTADFGTTMAHAANSAIIMNGRKTAVSLGGLSGDVIINGLAYIDFASRPVISSSGALEEYATGESLAVKSNQYIYLAPSEYLTVPNPLRWPDDGSEPPDADAAEVWPATGGWFGEENIGEGPYVTTHLVNSVSYVDLVAKDVYDRAGKITYRYYYLDLGTKAEEYAELVMNMPGDSAFIDANAADPRCAAYVIYTPAQRNQIWELKESLLSRLDNTDISVTNNYNRIFTPGVVPNYSGADNELDTLPGNSLPQDYVAKKEQEFYRRYISLYQALDPREGFSINNNGLGDGEPIINDYGNLAGDLSPAGNFVNFNALEQMAHSNQNNGIVFKNNYRDSGYGYAVMLHKDTANPAIINYDFDGNNDKIINGILISRGDVIIEDGFSFRGLIIAGGKITVKGDGFIENNVGVIQGIINEEMLIESAKPDGAPMEANHVLAYLTDINVSHSAIDQTMRVLGSDYTQYMSYSNWRRG